MAKLWATAARTGDHGNGRCGSEPNLGSEIAVRERPVSVTRPCRSRGLLVGVRDLAGAADGRPAARSHHPEPPGPLFAGADISLLRRLGGVPQLCLHEGRRTEDGSRYLPSVFHRHCGRSG